MRRSDLFLRCIKNRRWFRKKYVLTPGGLVSVIVDIGYMPNVLAVRHKTGKVN